MANTHIIDSKKFEKAKQYLKHDRVKCCKFRVFNEPTKTGFPAGDDRGQWKRRCGRCGKTVHYNLKP